ncbi:MAG: phosphate ABC transporter ATP-binding protein [Candidatus Thermoplasmatota archaeon]|nr:phosphate ABC transporter ATP-binding protein [Candidatus Thermoplasmatota archaeon]
MINGTKAHIETRNLSVVFHDTLVLDDISIKIPAKQLTAIIGPSGCGKTTLLKSFNRLLDIRDDVRISGDILVDGQNILNGRLDVPNIRKKMGLLSQKPYPLPMSIFENVAYGLRLHNHISSEQVRVKVRQCLEAAGLWNEVKDRLHDPASRLSVGQQQRLCLARAIAVEPEVLLCDEPTSALDPIAAQAIERLLARLKKEYTVVLVTHTLRQAKRLADYVIFLYFGKVAEMGPAAEIFTNPKNPDTLAYIDGDIS